VNFNRFGRRLARSSAAPIVAFPLRLRAVARHNLAVIAASAHWLATSREHTNYTFDLQPRNLEHLAWFVSAITGAPYPAVVGWFAEIAQDDTLRRHVDRVVRTSARRGLADRQARYGRRIGWYAMVRALRPALVVESGIDKGLGSCLIASALLRNRAAGHDGRLVALDIDPEAGFLITGQYRRVVDIAYGDSLQTIPQLVGPVDMFFHETMGTAAHEAAEYRLIESRLSPRGVLVTDNAVKTRELADYAAETGRRFLYFAEHPENHWFPGDGLGVAWRDPDRSGSV
jgi:predicted O-methyltransferase YrrM